MLFLKPRFLLWKFGFFVCLQELCVVASQGALLLAAGIEQKYMNVFYTDIKLLGQLDKSSTCYTINCTFLMQSWWLRLYIQIYISPNLYYKKRRPLRLIWSGLNHFLRWSGMQSALRHVAGDAVVINLNILEVICWTPCLETDVNGDVSTIHLQSLFFKMHFWNKL